MKPILKAFLSIAMVCFFIGCASVAEIPPEQKASADYGDYPDNYEQLIKDYFEVRLFDPYTANYKFSKPIKGYTRKAPVVGGGIHEFGYVVIVWINAKNRMGGYVGIKRYPMFIKNGVVSEIIRNPTYFKESWFQ